MSYKEIDSAFLEKRKAKFLKSKFEKEFDNFSDFCDTLKNALEYKFLDGDESWKFEYNTDLFPLALSIYCEKYDLQPADIQKILRNYYIVSSHSEVYFTEQQNMLLEDINDILEEIEIENNEEKLLELKTDRNDSRDLSFFEWSGIIIIFLIVLFMLLA